MRNKKKIEQKKRYEREKKEKKQ